MTILQEIGVNNSELLLAVGHWSHQPQRKRGIMENEAPRVQGPPQYAIEFT